MSRIESGRGPLYRDEDRRGVARSRGWLTALALAAAAAGFAPAPAQAATFQVTQCRTVALAPSANAGYQSALWDFTLGSTDPAQVDGCAGNGNSMNVTLPQRRLLNHEDTRIRFALPAGMADTAITTVDVAYQPHQQSASTNPAYFTITSEGTILAQHDMTGGYSNDAYRVGVPTGARSLDFRVWCSPANGPGYCNWSNHSFSIRGLTLTLEESVAPDADASGALLGAGAQRGTRPLEVTAGDADSGVRRIDVSLDGVTVGSADLAGDCSIERFSPCPTSVSRSIDVDTTRVPDGSRLLRLAVTDLAGNTRTVNRGYVAVDNVPAPSNTSIPTISGEKRVGRTLIGHHGSWSGDGVTFAHRWERHAAGGWEDIPDATQSTLTTTRHETGLRVRLKVTATSPEGTTVAYSDATNPIVAPGPTDADGDYDGDGIRNDADPDDDNDGTPDVHDAGPFDPAMGAPEAPRAVGVAPAFHTPNGQNASSSAALAAQFSDTRSKTITTRYGTVRHVAGTLTAASGAPIAGAQLSVTSQMLAMGATPVAVGTVTTDSSGRFRFAIPVGPSRRIEVAYKWFRESSQYTHTTTVTVNVVPRVTMKANRSRLRNGQRVSFAGKVAGAPRDARKVVELQARVGSSWQTFGTARLRSDGTFAYRYRFTRTSRPTTYSFRASVKAERGWPFLSGQSRATRVSVRP